MAFESPLVEESPLIEGDGNSTIRSAHPNEAIEAGVYVAAMNPSEEISTVDHMRQVKSDIALTGTSPEAQKVLLESLERSNDEAMDQLNKFIADEESTPDSILGALEGVRAAATGPIDLAESFARDNATIDLSETSEELEAQDNNAVFFKEIVEAEREMAKVGQFNPYARDNVASRTGYTLDGAAVMIPFNYQSGVREIKETLGLESSMWDLVFFGSALDDVRRHLEAMPATTRAQTIEELHQVLQNQGFTGTNEFIGHAMTQDLLINPQGSDDRVFIDNVIGVLDLIGVGQGLKGIFGGFKSALTTTVPAPLARDKVSVAVQDALGIQGMGIETHTAVLERAGHANPLRVAAKTNPRVAQTDIAAVIADDSGQLAGEVGMTKAAAINEWVLPKSHITDSPITAQPGGVSKEVLRVREQLQTTLKDIDTNVRLNFSEEELISGGVEAVEKVGKLFNSKTNVPSSAIKFTDKGIELSARFQANDVGGFTSIKKLQDHVENLFAKQSGEIKGLKIHKKHPQSGQWVDVSKQMGLKQNQQAGEYSFTLDFRMDADPAMKEAFGEDAISAGLGRLTKYATNPHALFEKGIISGAVVSKDKSALLQHRVLNVLSDNFTNLRKKAPEDFPSVLDAIRKGAIEEVWYDSVALKTKFGIKSKQAVESYEVFREVQDTLFQVSSKMQYKSLKRDGYSSIYVDSKYTGFNVRAISGDGSALVGKSVYVPTTQRAIKITNAEDLERLTQEGVQFGTLRSPIRVGDDEYQFAAVFPREGGTVDKLTHYPVPYKQGHYTRFYEDGNYVVKTTNNPNRTVNGLKDSATDEVIGIAKTRQEADLLLQQIADEERISLTSRGLDLETNSKSYEVITGEMWHTGKAVSERDWDIVSKSMLNINKRRGEHLRGMEDLASIEDPLEATAKQIGAVMDKATKQDWVDSQTSSWIKTFSKAIYGDDAPHLIGVWPTSTQELRSQVRRQVSRKPHLSDLGDRAIQHFEYVEMIKGTPAKMDEWWRTWNMKMAETTGVGTKQWQWLAKQKIQEEAKSVAFKILLGLNPIKHLQLQPSQILQLSFVEPRYIYNFGKNGLMRDFSDLAAYSSGKAVGADLKLPRGAELWEEFSRTGLSEAVAHHVYLNPGDFSKRLKPGILEPGAKAASRRAGSTIINAPQKLGFEAGERANVMTHWLVARRRWMDRNPGKDWKSSLARDEIHAEQRAISLNPNPAGKMGYQDWGTAWGGISSLFLQFFSHGHKTMMSMLPQKIGGSRVFTGAEKAKIAAANFTMFGTAVVPFLNDFMDDTAASAGWEVEPESWKHIKHGMIDIAMNRVLSTLSGEEQDIRFSTTFNPTTGIQAVWDNSYKFVMNDADYKPSVFAAAGVGSNIFNTLGTISTVWQQPTKLPEDKLVQSIQRLSELAPGWSAFVKGRIAKNTGWITSKTGSRVVQATSLEAAAKIMGWTIGAEEDYYDHMEKLNATLYKGSEKEIKMAAKDMLRDYMTIYKGSDRPVNETLIQLMSDSTIIFTEMRERRIFMDEVSRLTERALKTGEDNLISTAIKASVTGDKEELLEFLNNSPDVPDEVRKSIELMFEVRK